MPARRLYVSDYPTIRKPGCVDAKNSSGFTALDMVEHMPPGEIKSEIYNILQHSGGVRAKDLVNRSHNTIGNTRQIGLSLITTMFVFLTGVGFFSPFEKQQNLRMTRLFIVFNSSVFTVLVAVLTFSIRDFPCKPWPQIYLMTLFVSYVCSPTIFSPFSTEGWILLFGGFPFLLLAAAGKRLGSRRSVFLFSLSLEMNRIFKVFAAKNSSFASAKNMFVIT